MSEIVVDGAIALMALWAGAQVRGWAGRFLWMVVAALVLTITFNRVIDLAMTRCWPWNRCDSFELRFDATPPPKANSERKLYVPRSADRVRLALRRDYGRRDG